jgi:hypothetical protein
MIHFLIYSFHTILIKGKKTCGKMSAVDNCLQSQAAGQGLTSPVVFALSALEKYSGFLLLPISLLFNAVSGCCLQTQWAYSSLRQVSRKEEDEKQKQAEMLSSVHTASCRSQSGKKPVPTRCL